MVTIIDDLKNGIKNRKQINWKKKLTEYSLILIGTFIMAVGFIVFISPLKLAPGGVYVLTHSKYQVIKTSCLHIEIFVFLQLENACTP